MKVRFPHPGFILAAAAIIAGTAHAQSPATSNRGLRESGSAPLSLSGEIGTYGELYSIEGAEARRPPSTGRLFFRPTLNLFDALSLDFDFLLSTEGSQARQDINQFGVNPTWRWGQAHLGDFTETYSQYTLGGIRIRGGGFFINPGVFRLGAIGGVTRRAVSGTADNAAYDRYLYGGRIGVGTAEGGFFDLLFLRVRDKVSSLSTPAAVTVLDSTNPAATAVQQYAVTPQENLIVGMMSYLSLFDSHVHWNLEASGSAFTRDMSVTEDKSLNLPAWVDKIYHANVTSSAGLAVRTDLSLNYSNVTVRTGYRYVSPAYNSLGVGSLLNDWQEFSLAPSFRLGTSSLALNAFRQNDNLLGQKLNTLVRYQFGGNLNFQPVDRWMANILCNYLTMSNDADNDTVRVSYSSLTLGTNQYIMFSDESFLQSVNLSYLFQQSGDNSPLRAGMKFSSHSANAGLTIPLGGNVSLSPGAGLVVTVIPSAPQQVTTSYLLSAQHHGMDNMLLTVLSGVMSVGENTTSYRSTLSSIYRITESASIGLVLTMMRYTTSASYGVRFTEYSASMNLTQRF